jgi:hypothetical protein
MAYYTEPTSNDTQGFYEFFNYINEVATEGLFFPVMLLVIWVITFMGTKQYTTAKAWTTASVITGFLSVPLAIMGLISTRWMYLLFVLIAAGVLWLKIEQ